jgi:hypothetical protein
LRREREESAVRASDMGTAAKTVRESTRRAVSGEKTAV